MVHVERHCDLCTNETTELNGNTLNYNDFDKFHRLKPEITSEFISDYGPFLPIFRQRKEREAERIYLDAYV